MGKMAAGVALDDGHHDFKYPKGVSNCHSRGHIQDAWAQESPSIVLAEDPFEMDRPPVDVRDQGPISCLWRCKEHVQMSEDPR